MKRHRSTRTLACLVLGAGAASFAGAQPVESLTLTIEWDKPVIGPGETNTGKLLATVGPDLGTITAWNTKPGTGQAGTLKAFASAIFNFMGMENGLNGTFQWTIPAEFNISSKPGMMWPTGGAAGVNAGQFGHPANPQPNVNQTVTLLQFKWSETAGGGPYNVLFETELLSAKVYLDVGLAAWVGENAVKIDGEGGFMVIPAPSAIAFAVPLFLVAGTRRRRP